MEPGFLLIPGPVPLPPRVLEEFSKPARPHYGDAWVKAHSETREMLRYLWSAPDAHVFPIAGPGHAALEAIAYTFLRPGDRVVVVSNGFFGDRVREVLLTHRVKAEVVASPWGAGSDIPALRDALKTRPKAVAVIHNETSTGVTNPLEPIVEAAHAVDAAVIVDAVSSLGGIPLPFAKLGIEAAFSASQKCIAAPAGIAGRRRPVPVGVHGSTNRRRLVSEPLHVGPVRAGVGRMASHPDDDFLELVLRLPPRTAPLERGRPRGTHCPAHEDRRAVSRRPRGTWVLTHGTREPVVEHGRMLRPSR